MRAVSKCSFMCGYPERLAVTVLELTHCCRVLFPLVFLCSWAVLSHAGVSPDDLEEKSQTNLTLDIIQKFINVHTGNLHDPLESLILPRRQAQPLVQGVRNGEAALNLWSLWGGKIKSTTAIFLVYSYFFHLFFFLIIFFSFSS